MCKQLEISRAAYYKWLDREIPKQESENLKLAELIKEYDQRFGHILGYRRMTSSYAGIFMRLHQTRNGLQM